MGRCTCSRGVAHAGWLVLDEELLVGFLPLADLLPEPADLEVVGNDAAIPERTYRRR